VPFFNNWDKSTASKIISSKNFQIKNKTTENYSQFSSLFWFLVPMKICIYIYLFFVLVFLIYRQGGFVGGLVRGVVVFCLSSSSLAAPAASEREPTCWNKREKREAPLAPLLPLFFSSVAYCTPISEHLLS